MLKQKRNRPNRFASAATRHQHIYVDKGTPHDPLAGSPYPSRLNFYVEPPPLEITIEEFELFALDRLQGSLGYLFYLYNAYSYIYSV